MYEQKMDSTFSEELEAMEALEAYVSRLFFYDVHDLDCAAPQQENGYLVVTGPDTPLSRDCPIICVNLLRGIE